MAMPASPNPLRLAPTARNSVLTSSSWSTSARGSYLNLMPARRTASWTWKASRLWPSEVTRTGGLGLGLSWAAACPARARPSATATPKNRRSRGAEIFMADLLGFLQKELCHRRGTMSRTGNSRRTHIAPSYFRVYFAPNEKKSDCSREVPMTPSIARLASIAVICVLSGFGSGPQSAAAQSALSVEVLSSRPELVTGGDALVRIMSPEAPKVTVGVNDV